MFCENCGNQIPEGAKFCEVCGTPVPTLDQETVAGARQDSRKDQEPAEQQDETAGNWQDSGYPQESGGQQDSTMGYWNNDGYQQDNGYQQNGGYQQNYGYQQNGGYQQDNDYWQNGGYQPKPPRKPIPKKYFVIAGAAAAICLALAIAIPVVSSVMQSSKDRKNAELYEQYKEELEDTNQKAAEKIMQEIGGTSNSADAKKK